MNQAYRMIDNSVVCRISIRRYKPDCASDRVAHHLGPVRVHVVVRRTVCVFYRLNGAVYRIPPVLRDPSDVFLWRESPIQQIARCPCACIAALLLRGVPRLVRRSADCGAAHDCGHKQRHNYYFTIEVSMMRTPQSQHVRSVEPCCSTRRNTRRCSQKPLISSKNIDGLLLICCGKLL